MYKQIIKLVAFLSVIPFVTKAQITSPVTITGTSCSPANLTATLTNSMAIVINPFNTDSVVWQRNGITVQTYYNQPYTIVAGGNGLGANANQLTSPQGFTIDAQENVYVADVANHRIQKWAKNATSGVTVAGGNGQGDADNQLSSPFDVARDNTSALYVCDRANHRIQKWAKNATSGVTVAGGNGNGNATNQLYNPTAIWLQPNGDLYIADEGNNRIVLWEKGATDGIVIANVYSPLDLLVDGNNLYVASAHHSIEKVDLTDNSVTTFFGSGNNPVCTAGSIYRALGLAIDTDKNIYVSGNCFVKKIDSLGNELFTYSSPTNNTMKIQIFNNILYLSSPNNQNDRVIALTPKSLSPSYLNNVNAGTYTCYFYKDGVAYASNSFMVGNTPNISLQNTSTNICDTIQSIKINGVPNSANVKWYKDGNLITDEHLDKNYTAQGYLNNLSVLGNACQTSVYGGFGYTGNYVAIDTGGKIYVTQLCTSAGGNSKVVIGNLDYLEGYIQGQVFSKLGDARGICFDKQNNLYVGDNTNKCIVKYMSGATRNSMGTVICKASIAKINDVFVDDLGRIYVCDSISRVVYRYPANSNEFTLPTIVAGGGILNGSTIKQLVRPTGITVDENYNVIVVQNSYDAYGRVITTPNRILLFPNTYTSTNNVSGQVLLTDNGFDDISFFDAELDKDKNLYVLFHNKLLYQGGFLKFNNCGSLNDISYSNKNYRQIIGNTYLNLTNIAIDKTGTNIYTGSLQWRNIVKFKKTNTSVFMNQSGTYTATVTDTITGCSSTASITITIPAKLDSTQGNNSVCVGSSIQLTNTTPNGVWSSVAGRATVNANGLVTGTSAGAATIRYTVTNVNGCVSYIDKLISVNAIPAVPSIAYAPNTRSPQTAGVSSGIIYLCNKKTFGLVGSPSNGVWSTTGTITATPVNTPSTNTSIFSGLGVGSASVKYEISDNNGCKNNKTINCNVVACAAKAISSLVNDNSLPDIVIFPNPAKNEFNIQYYGTDVAKYYITSILGKQVNSGILSLGINPVNICNLVRGVYFVNIVTQQTSYTQKIVVE